MRATSRRLLAAALPVLLGGCSTPGSGPETTAAAGPAAIMAAAVRDHAVPGAALVILKGDQVVLAQGFGVESVERTDPVRPTTTFALGSLSAQLTAVAVLTLAEERKLSVDDPVARWLPEFSRLPAGLRIRHLLTHTSGMRDFFVQPELDAVFGRPEATLEDVLAIARHSPADFMPGSRWSYANINYLMLQVIVERATKKTLEDYVENRVVAPLGLLTLKPCPPHPGSERGFARGHLAAADGRLVAHPPEAFHLYRGAGGYCGSAVDVAAWTRALATGKVVSPASYAEMTSPVRLHGERTAHYGIAMALVAPDGPRRIGHGGYGGGFSMQAAYYPDAELTVVVMLNRFAFPEHVERRVVHDVLGLAQPVIREVGLPPAERQRFAGSYDVGVAGWYPTLSDRDGKLWFEMPSLPPQPLTYVGDGEFVQEDQPYGYRMKFGPERPPSEVRILGMGLMSWYGVRRD